MRISDKQEIISIRISMFSILNGTYLDFKSSVVFFNLKFKFNWLPCILISNPTHEPSEKINFLGTQKGNVSVGSQGSRCWGRVKRAKAFLHSKTWEREREKAGLNVEPPDLTKFLQAQPGVLTKDRPLGESMWSIQMTRLLSPWATQSPPSSTKNSLLG